MLFHTVAKVKYILDSRPKANAVGNQAKVCFYFDV